MILLSVDSPSYLLYSRSTDNLDIINQTDIETAMKNVESGDAGKGNLVVSENPVWKFDLSKFALNKTSGFTATAVSPSMVSGLVVATSRNLPSSPATGYLICQRKLS